MRNRSKPARRKGHKPFVPLSDKALLSSAEREALKHQEVLKKVRIAAEQRSADRKNGYT